MIALIRQIIVCVTAASLFGAVALALVPKGTVREVIRLGVGMVLILSLAVPLRSMSVPTLNFSVDFSRTQQESEQLAQEEIVREVERESAEYIASLARQRGMRASACVAAQRSDSGVVTLEGAAVTLNGSYADGEITRLKQEISDALCMDAAHIAVEKEGAD